MTNVTIGLPVYNGADTIGEALDCVLNGSCRDVRIIVSDNASTDNTASIVEDYCQRDDRISLHRQPQNLGPVGNFRFVAEQAKTPYFAWRAHDDITDEHYIEHLSGAILNNNRAALVAPHTVTSKPKGDRHRPFAPKLTGKQTAGIFQLPKAEAGWFYGLYRTEIAQQASAFSHTHYLHVWGWDFIIILYAAVHGGIIGCNDARFIHRLFSPPSDTYNFSKQQFRKITTDFYKAGLQLAEQKQMSGTELVRYKYFLWRMILRRVVRPKRMI